MLHSMVRRIPILRRRVGARLAVLSSSLALVAGRPNETALPLAYWKMDGPEHHRRDPAVDGCGLIWYSPLVEMTPGAVRRFVDMASNVMRTEGFEPLITLSSLSERCFDSTVPVLFDGRSPDRAEAARKCHLALLQEGARNGFFPYRLDVQSMDWLTRRAPDHWKIVTKLKQALDPEGIIAPGRYARVTSS